MSEKNNSVKELTREELRMISGGAEKKVVILFCKNCNKDVPHIAFSETLFICSVCRNATYPS